MIFSTFSSVFSVLVLAASVSAVKELGKGCKLSSTENECGRNAKCLPLSPASQRTAIGMCWCNDGFRQAASIMGMTPDAQNPLRQRMGAAYWTDCVAVGKVGGPCTKGNDSQLPPNAQCNARGVIECKPGRGVKNGGKDYDCDLIATTSKALYGEPCNAKATCDTARGLQCQGTGQPVCKCATGVSWRNDTCQPNVGDRCQKDADCQTADDPSGGFAAKMVCRGGSCACPANSQMVAMILPSAMPVLNTPKGPMMAPTRVDPTGNEAKAPIGSGCLRSDAFKFNSTGQLGLCTLDAQYAKKNGGVFTTCQSGLYCSYFPTDTNDANTMGRCTPTSATDSRWFGSEGPGYQNNPNVNVVNNNNNPSNNYNYNPNNYNANNLNPNTNNNYNTDYNNNANNANNNYNNGRNQVRSSASFCQNSFAVVAISAFVFIPFW